MDENKLSFKEYKEAVVDHPNHYTKQVPGIECIDVTEHFNFNRGNAIKYIWRAGEKDDEVQDLRKAIWYLNREIERINKNESNNGVQNSIPYSIVAGITPGHY